MKRPHQVLLRLEELEVRLTPSTGSGGSIPNIMGTYYGYYTAYNNQETVIVQITNENSDGSFTGMITTTPAGQTSPSTTSFQGTVHSDGSFTATDAALASQATGRFSAQFQGSESFAGALAHINGDGSTTPYPNGSIQGSETIAAD
jgi:hypothetical protein